MKIAITMVMTMLMAIMCGCESSSERGGSVREGEGFRITVPGNTDVTQGETRNIDITLDRGDYFKQDVKLQINASKGINVEPTKVLVKASDTPDVQLQISVPKDAALGSYKVSVKAKPATGEPTSTEFDITVVAP